MSGCLPLLIQMPILLGLIDVIYRPLKHILRIPADIIAQGEQIVGSLGLMGNRPATGFGPQQIYIIQGVHDGLQEFNALGADVIAQINGFSLNFLGMNLGTVPSLSMFGDILKGSFDAALLIPILSGISALALSVISMRHTPMPEGGANASMKGMMYMMPLFSVMIAFQVPAGVGLYWVYSNVVQMAQSVILNKFYNPKEMAEKARLEMEERRERERLERIEAKKKAKASGELDERGLSPKELNKKKIAEARKRMAEKYGEEYDENQED
jgi:YidC/Oxa1 family membrane protein insertase